MGGQQGGKLAFYKLHHCCFPFSLKKRKEKRSKLTSLKYGGPGKSNARQLIKTPANSKMQQKHIKKTLNEIQWKYIKLCKSSQKNCANMLTAND